MTILKLTFKKPNIKRLIIITPIILLTLGFSFTIIRSYQLNLLNISSIFGYMDFQNNWQGLDNFIHLKTLFKDYYYEYGWFFLAIQSVGYILTDKTFLSVIISREIFLPIISIIISVVIAKKILKKYLLIIIFLSFCLLYNVNNNYTSLRHLIAELSLAIFITNLTFRASNIYSGIIAGLSMLTALEYGIALNIAIFLYFLIIKLQNILKKINDQIAIKKFIFGESIILIPCFFWLLYKGAFINFIMFTTGFIKGFYQFNPCSGAFPRLTEITNQTISSGFTILNIPIEFLQRLNFYIVFIFYIIIISFICIKIIFFRGLRKTSAYQAENERSTKDSSSLARNLRPFRPRRFHKEKFSFERKTKLLLSIYGVVIYSRTLITPCLDYFTYSLIPFFLLLTIILENIFHSKSKYIKSKFIKLPIIIIIFFWLILTQQNNLLLSIFNSKSPSQTQKSLDKKYYSPAGWYLDSNLVDNYLEIEKIISNNTNKTDSIYVYPWGPYNQISNQQSSAAISNKYQLIAGEVFVDEVIESLKSQKPKLIIVNSFNGGGIAHFGKDRWDVTRYYSYKSEDGPVFNGYGEKIEKYILENYQTVYHNDVAIVLKPRPYSIKVERKTKEYELWNQAQDFNCRTNLNQLIATEIPNQFQIQNEKASLSLECTPLTGSDVFIKTKLNYGFLQKYLIRLRFKIHISAIIEGVEQIINYEELALGEWQTIRVPLPKDTIVKSITIEIGDNYGLIWWLYPKTLNIESMKIIKDISS